MSRSISVLVLLAAVVGCSKPAAPADVEVTDIVVGRALAPDGSIAEEARTNSFWTTDPFCVSVQLEGTADDIVLEVRWTGPDGAHAAEARRTISPRGTTVTVFEVRPPNDGRWRAGDYTVEILVDGQSQGSTELNAR